MINVLTRLVKNYDLFVLGSENLVYYRTIAEARVLLDRMQFMLTI